MNEIHRINPPTAVVLNERKFPVITNDPSWSDVLGNLRGEDFSLLAKFAAVGAPVGYWIGSRNYASRQGMLVGTLMFGAAAFAKVVQTSAARLLGIVDNGPEYRAMVEQPGK